MAHAVEIQAHGTTISRFYGKVNNMITDDLATQGAMTSVTLLLIYRQVPNIRRTLVDN